MEYKSVHGQQLLLFFLNHNYVIQDNEFGQVIVCHRNEMDTIATPINIPTNMIIPPGLLKNTLARGGFTETEFWNEIG